MITNDVEFEVKKKQLAEIMANPDGNNQGNQTEFDQLSKELDEYVGGKVNTAHATVIKAMHTVMKDENGESRDHKKELDEMADNNAKIAKKRQDEMNEIKAGITNEAAKLYVTNLNMQVNGLKKIVAQKGLEVKMLQKNNGVFEQEIEQEIKQMGSYLAGVSGVFDTFTNRILESIKKRSAGTNESRKATSNTTESN